MFPYVHLISRERLRPARSFRGDWLPEKRLAKYTRRSLPARIRVLRGVPSDWTDVDNFVTEFDKGASSNRESVLEFEEFR